MRKLNNPMPSGGAPFNNEDLNDVFQTEIWAALQALLSKYDGDSQGVIVSGCVVSANASNFDMTAGIVYLNGEFMRVDAVTNQTFTKYIKAATPTNVARTFENSSSQTFIIEKEAQVSASVDAGGQEITISTLYSSLYRRLEFLEGSHTVYKTSAGVSSNKKLLTKIIEIGDWDMDSTDAIFVNHELSDNTKIRGLKCLVISDNGLGLSDLSHTTITTGTSSDTPNGSIQGANATQVSLSRTTGGAYDNTDFNSTSYNRGWLVIEYEG